MLNWCGPLCRTELWSLSREVLDETVEKFPELVPKFNQFLLTELERKNRLATLSYRILISMCTRHDSRRAALILQKVRCNPGPQ